MKLLASYLAYQKQLYSDFGHAWHVTGPIFTSEIGNAMSPGSLSEWTSKFLKKIGVPELSLKDMRHLSISLLAMKNLPIQNISSRAGHARTSTTQNMYVHLFQGADEMTSKAMDETLSDAGFDPFAEMVTNKIGNAKKSQKSPVSK